MKVVYDVSIFGGAQLWSHTRSGIYRVAESLASALIDSGKCVLSFSAVEPFLHNYAIHDLKQSGRFPSVPFPYSKVHYELFARFLEANQKVAQTTGLSRVNWRARRKMRHLANSLVNIPLFKSEPTDEASLRAADIFHSPYYAIPAAVRRHSQLRTFLTVHDLIPILCPQFFDAPDAGNQHHLKGIIDGIRPNDWITCVSRKTKEDLCHYRPDLDPNRVTVTPLGASAWFHPCLDVAEIKNTSDKYKIPDGEYILSVCTLEPRKNLPHLIRSFLKMIRQERLSNLSLVLVGSLGWKYEAIFSEVTAADADLRNRIVLTGRVEDEDMAALYSGSLAFVYPSLYEGFGLPPLEAMQCGAPVITSNSSSLPEVVGNAGILVDPQDGDALCQAMLRLVNDRTLRSTMSQQSLAQAKLFGWDRCGDQTIEAYQTALGSD